jgi:hypothetical protein
LLNRVVRWPNEKENRPGQQAVNSDTRGSDVTPPAYTVQASKRIPKKHRARTYMLRCGAGGWTENDILRNCRLSSGRNYATELERELSIYLERLEEKILIGSVLICVTALRAVTM